MGRAKGSITAAGQLTPRGGERGQPAPEAEDDFALYDLHADWLTGWSDTHDYDPTWDYEVRFHQREHPLLRAAQEQADGIIKRYGGDDRVPFTEVRVYPVDLSGVGEGGAVAMFVSGTSSDPVVVIDIDAHVSGIREGNQHLSDDELARTIEAAVRDSVVHELRHSVQESMDLPMDEDEAEHGGDRLPF